MISKKAKRFIWTIGRVPSITPSKPCVCSFFIRFSSRAAQGSTFDSQSMLSESLLDESLVSNFDNEKLSNIYAQVAFKVRSDRFFNDPLLSKAYGTASMNVVQTLI